MQRQSQWLTQTANFPETYLKIGMTPIWTHYTGSRSEQVLRGGPHGATMATEFSSFTYLGSSHIHAQQIIIFLLITVTRYSLRKQQ